MHTLQLSVDSAKVQRCAGVLEDDHYRQGGILTYDDVTRVISRMQLSVEETASLRQLISRRGIQIQPATDTKKVTTSRYESLAIAQRPDAIQLAYHFHDLLTHEEEVRLARRYRAEKGSSDIQSVEASERVLRMPDSPGDSARSQLLLSNIRLVSHCAKTFVDRTTFSLEDLIQEGILGLIRAVEKYDPERGFKFSTYATWWINQFIARAITDKSHLVRLPENVAQKVGGFRKRQHKLRDVLGRAPTVEELAVEVGIGPSEVNLILRLQTDARSLSETYSVEATESSELHERVPGKYESPDQFAERRELKRLIRQVLRTLDKRSQYVLVLRFGLLGRKPRTLEQVGKRLGITRERVRQIEAKAIARISATSRSTILKPYAEELGCHVQS